MAGDYKLPLAVTDRVRFYDGQFLQDQDFIDEQKYHLARHNRHHRTLHVTGVAEGLTAYAPANTTFQVKVRPGLALDPDGRQILLTQISSAIDLPANAADSERWLYIAYHQVPDKLQSSSQGIEGETRWREDPYIFSSDNPNLGVDDDYGGPDWSSYLAEGDGPPPPVQLAKLAIDAGGRVSVDNNVRHFSGLRLPGPDTLAPTLRTDPAGNVGLWLVKDNDLSERLTISPEGNVGINTNAPTAPLEIGSTLKATRNGQSLVAFKIAPTFDADGKTNVKNYGLLVESGNVGIGTTSPGAMLDVKGSTVVQSYLLVGQTSTTGYQKVTADSNNLIVNGQFAAGGSAGSAIYKLGIGYAPPSQGEGTLIVSGNVGIGTISPGSKLDVAGETRILAGSKDVVFSSGNFGSGNTTDLFFNKSDVGFNQSEFVLYNQNDNVEGSRYFQLQYSADAGGLTIRKGGNVGIGTTEPSAGLEVNGSFKASSNVSGERELYTESPNAGNHRGDGNTQNATGLVYRVAQNPDNGDPILQVRSQGEAVRFFVEHDGWTGSTLNSAWFGGTAKANHFANKVGIGTTDPQAVLDVNGRILRKGQSFSYGGYKSHGATVSVPWGTRDDWKIFVSPRSMGKEESGSEGDNALLKIECRAISNNDTSWTIHARYRYRFGNGDGSWYDGSANYLLVPE